MLRMSHLLLVVLLTLILSPAKTNLSWQGPVASAETLPQQQPGVRYINPESLERNPRYTQVVEISGGRMLLISGQAANDKDGKVVGRGDFRRQAEQVFGNIKAAVEAAGGSLDDIVKLNSYIVDIGSNLPAYRNVRVSFFSKNKNQPASTTVGVSSLVNPDLLLEVEAVAVIKDKER